MNQRNSGGISISSLLGIAFVILKLTGVIDWSWWWVTLPFWGGIALVIGLPIVLILIGGIIVGIVTSVISIFFKILEYKDRRNARKEG